MCADKLAALPFEMTFLKPLQADSNGIATFKTRLAPNIKHHSQRHHAKFHKAQLHWSAPVCLLNNFSVLEVILHREDISITLVSELVREFKFMHYVSRSSKCPHAIVIKKLCWTASWSGTSAVLCKETWVQDKGKREVSCRAAPCKQHRGKLVATILQGHRVAWCGSLGQHRHT